MTDRPLDLGIKHVRVVRPNRTSIDRLDLGIKDGRFARIAPDIPAADARDVYDAADRLGFPGVVDAHTQGMDLTGRVDATFLRGQQIRASGRIVGAPTGRYIKHPSPVP